MDLSEDLPDNPEDFYEDNALGPEEWMALVEHHEGEAWVWDQMSSHAIKEHGKKKDAKDYKAIADYHRKRARVFKGYAAQEEDAQSKFSEQRKAEIEKSKRRS